MTTDRAEWPEIDVSGKVEITIGRSHACKVQLSHLTVSKMHARLVRGRDGLEVEDLASTYGTAVNGVLARKTRLKPGDIVRFGEAPAYRFDGSRLRVITEASGVSIRLADVVVERGGRRLLDTINLNFDAGSFVALLGPSGAGKSVLLGCLGSTLTPSSGDITFNGGERLEGESLRRYRSKLGVVPQDDLVYGALTVRENIRFAARLRLPDMPSTDLEARIDSIMADVSLTEHQSKLVRVLSGGQRKRIGVANELIMRPGLLLLDEPTSGLDPGMQAKVMDMLRGLARQGITIVTSTHTMDTLHYFDSVVVLAPGPKGTRLVFQGIPSELLPAFEVRDSADLFDKLTKGDLSNPGARFSDAAEADAESASGRSSSLATPLQSARPPDEAAGSRRWKTVVQQAGVVFKRSWPLLLRDRGSLLLTVGQPLFLALLVVLSQASKVISQSIYIHFYLVIAAIWMGMTQTVREVVRDRPFFMRDRLAGLLPNSFLAGKVLFGGAVAAGQAAAMYLVARLMIWMPSLLGSDGARIDLLATPFLGALAVLVLAAISGALIGLTISCISATEQAAVGMLPLAVLPQILFARVSSGQAMATQGEGAWTTHSAYGLIAELPDSFSGLSNIDRLQMMVSLPLPSRPATAVMDTLRPGLTLGADSHAIEWLYLIVLVLLTAVMLYVVFHQRQARWRTAR